MVCNENINNLVNIIVHQSAFRETINAILSGSNTQPSSFVSLATSLPISLPVKYFFTHFILYFFTRVIRVSVLYVPTCQKLANFSFLRANVLLNVRRATVPKACQYFNLACQFFNLACQRAKKRANLSTSPAKRRVNFSTIF